MKGLIAGLGALLVLGVGFFLYSSPTAPSVEMTEADREGIAQEIRQVVQEGFEMVAANDDFEGMMASWSGDPSAYFVGEPAMYLNRLVLLTDVEAINAYWEPSIQTRSGTNMIPSQEHVAVLSPDIALHVFKGDWSVLDLEGNVSSEGPITVTTLFVREDGEWKQLHYHQSWDRAVEEDPAGG